MQLINIYLLTEMATMLSLTKLWYTIVFYQKMQLKNSIKSENLQMFELNKNFFQKNFKIDKLTS